MGVLIKIFCNWMIIWGVNFFVLIIMGGVGIGFDF